MRPRNNRCGLTLLELAVSVAIIAVFIGTFFTFIFRTAIHAKEVTLQAELSNLRLSLDLYQALKGNNPPDLKALIQARYSAAGTAETNFGAQFLSFLETDAQGHPVDPFGNRFYYDAKREAIRSQSKGYENW